MSDFKAPWEFNEDLRAIFDADGTAVAFLPNRHDPARARLLLASPRLLEALKEVISIGWRGSPVILDPIDKARALIAEIEGGGTDREEYPDHGPTDPWQTSGPGGGT